MSDCEADHERPAAGDLPVVFTVSGLCGSAKTHTATRWAHTRARWGAKVLIAQPSKKLVDQTMADLRSLGGAVPARAAHEGTCDGPVRTLVRHTEEAGEGGEVLLATQAALGTAVAKWFIRQVVRPWAGARCRADGGGDDAAVVPR